jgi:hypothetical protein
MEKIVNRLIDDAVQKVDTYTNNGSTWLIFTDDKRWVIELTKDGTLWYNYNFFNSLFAYASMDVIENQHYITKWVENNVINKKKPVKNEVKEASCSEIPSISLVDHTIQNGVKNTLKISNHRMRHDDRMRHDVEDTIHNGVIAAHHQQHSILDKVKDTIQNGVKDTLPMSSVVFTPVEYAIQNGIKETKEAPYYPNEVVDTIIQDGVKNTISFEGILNWDVEDTIENGVKETSFVAYGLGTTVEDTIQNGVKNTFTRRRGMLRWVEDTIQNGVKNTYSDKIPHEYDWTDQFDVKEVIETGVKHTEKSLQIDGSCVIEDVIKEGVKHTEYGDWEDGDERLDDIIKNGIKKTEAATLFDEESKMNAVISEGIKETHDDVYHHNGRIEGVIKNGIKEVQPLPAQDGNRDWGFITIEKKI